MGRARRVLMLYVDTPPPRKARTAYIVRVYGGAVCSMGCDQGTLKTYRSLHGESQLEKGMEFLHAARKE
jgi:hypothetical protein